MSEIAVIGSGFAGLSTAAYLAAAGHNVHVYEKNATTGGRARQLQTRHGYVFDMGPSWYWMPDIYEAFFNDFGYKTADFYSLKLLDPSFEIVLAGNQNLRIPSRFPDLCLLFESIEKGSGRRLQDFMEQAKYNYQAGMKNMAYMPGLSVTEFAGAGLLKKALTLRVFSAFSKHVSRYFSDPRLIALMEFPVLFLGAMPKETPAMYSLMNYAGLKLGTWYPQGGFGKVAEAIQKVAENNGAVFHFNAPVEKISIKNRSAAGIVVNGESISCSVVVSTADYHHTESKLLPPGFRNYNENYWQKKTFAPSCLIYFLGISKKIPSLQHHTLFFEEDLLRHTIEIYKTPKWPSKPLFYVCCPSRTDSSTAPAGHENLFLLMPLAAGLEDTETLRETYFNRMMTRLENHAGEPIKPFIDFKKSYGIKNFVTDYNSYKGNAYGLANTLAQTAVFKPKVRNKKVNNLFYAGQLTVPGPGVPPALISGKIAAEQVLKHLREPEHETVIR